MIPLSTRMRPETLDDFTGQEHFIYKGSLLYNSIVKGTFDSAIFYGPSGTGKTTLARIIASRMDPGYREVNASVTGTADMRKLISDAKDRLEGLEGRPTYVYIDEIHRWNRSQQDILLKAIEEGVIRFIASTTENPYFSINNAILSRVGNIYEFRRLETEELEKLLCGTLENRERGLGNLEIEYDEKAIRILAEMANGDARVALDTLGFIVDNLDLPGRITPELVGEAMQRKIDFYDRKDDKYNLLSALQKSIRGSDPDAAIYYFARLVDGGAEIETIGRRLMVMASEDIGIAYPSAVSVVTSCVQAAHMIGYPEAAINLSQAVILLASSPKSNASYMAYNRALADVKNGETFDIPDHLKDTHYKGAADMGYGEGYLYPHDYGGYVEQQYLPDSLCEKKVSYYRPTENGSEGAFKNYLKGLDSKYGDNQGG